ncbi:MAG: hypothetical protein QUS09_09210, partial [Methanotrichaceae archaeon]|nr:hypothetical protein [Methanotrichaceae archaeon]
MLALIDKYRFLPRFQVERHFDIYLIPFLATILNQLGHGHYDFILPEFPIQKCLFSERAKNNWESISMDYAAFDRDNQRIALIELKTDLESNRESQNEFLRSIEGMDLHSLLRFIEDRGMRGRDVKTLKFSFLASILQKNGLEKCFHGKPLVIKITPDNKREGFKPHIQFSDLLRVEIDSEEWIEVREYLKKWNTPIRDELRQVTGLTRP